MLTPQNFREKTFERAVFGGYDMGAVDDFLEEAANDYAAVAKEIGRSASSVSKYVQMKDVPRNIKIAVENLSQKGDGR